MNKPVSSYGELVNNMLLKALEFDKHLTSVKQLNTELLTKSEKVLKALKEMLGSVQYEAKRFCNVCYCREPRVALGCGHVFAVAVPTEPK